MITHHESTIACGMFTKCTDVHKYFPFKAPRLRNNSNLFPCNAWRQSIFTCLGQATPSVRKIQYKHSPENRWHPPKRAHSFITPTMWRWFHKRSHRELLLACLSHAIYQYLHVRMSSFIGDLSAFKSILLLYNKIMYSIYWDPSGEDVLGIWVDFDLLILPTSHVEIVFVPKKKEKARRLSQFCCLGDMGI